MDYYGNNDYRDYLSIQHHGIMGMKWGKRNGPPYPLGASDHSASEKKAGWRKSLNGGSGESVKKKAKKIIQRGAGGVARAGSKVKGAAKSGVEYVKRNQKNNDDYRKTLDKESRRYLSPKSSRDDRADAEMKILDAGNKQLNRSRKSANQLRKELGIKEKKYESKSKGITEKLKISDTDSKVTQKVKRDYNNLPETDFKRKYAVSKKTYAKRVAKYGDPYMNSPMAKLNKKLQAEGRKNMERHVAYVDKKKAKKRAKQQSSAKTKDLLLYGVAGSAIKNRKK